LVPDSTLSGPIKSEDFPANETAWNVTPPAEKRLRQRDNERLSSLEPGFTQLAQHRQTITPTSINLFKKKAFHHDLPSQ